MANVRTCVLFLVLLVNYRLVASQPTFGTQIWCNMFCGDSDSEESSDDSEDYSFFDLFDVCYGCSSKSSSSESEATTEKPASQPVNVMIPPSTGLNLTVFGNTGGLLMNLVPWLAPATTPATTAAPTTAAPATTAAGSSEATTAAATTAKP